MKTVFTELTPNEVIQALGNAALQKRRLAYQGRCNIQVMTVHETESAASPIRNVRVELELLEE